MKNVFLRLATGLLNSLIVFTLLMLPVSQHGGNFNVGYVYAEDETPGTGEPFDPNEACVNDDGSQAEGYYVKGCAFRDDQIDMQEWKGSWDELEVINYLMILITSLVFISSIDFQPYQDSMEDCPQNVVGKTTIPLVAGAAAAQLVEEILMNFLYKDKANQAAALYIEGSKTKDNQDSQLEAFDQLISLYEDMKAMQIARVVIHSILAAVYTGATTAEAVNIVSCNSQCTAMKNVLRTGVESTLATLQTTAGTLAANGATCATAAASMATPCANVGTEANRAAVTLRETWADIEMEAFLRAFTESEEYYDLSVELGAALPSFMVPILTISMAQVQTTNTTNQTEETVDQTEEQAGAAEAGTEQAIDEAQEAAIRPTIEPLSNTCFNGAYAACQAESAAANIAFGAAQVRCAPYSPCAGYTATTQAFLASAEAVTNLFDGQALCCGANTAEGNQLSILRDGPPDISTMQTMQDINYENLGIGSLFYEPNNYIEKYKIDLENKKVDIAKAIAYNGMMKYYMEKKMVHYPNDPDKNLQEYVKYHNRIEKLMEADPIELLRKPLSPQQVELAMTNHLGIPKGPETNMFATMIASIGSHLWIADAHAFIDFSEAGTKLGVAVLVIIIAYLLRSYVRELFLTKPLNRTLTYGFMALISGAQIVIDAVTLDRIGSHLDAVKAERQRFLDASAHDTGLDDGSGGEGGGGPIETSTASSGANFFGNQANMNCEAQVSQANASDREVRKGEAISTACAIRGALPQGDPSVVPRNSALGSSGFDMSPVAGLMPSINSMQNGMSPSHESIQGGDMLASAQNANNMIKKLKDNAFKHYDKTFSGLKDKDRTYLPLAQRIKSAFDKGRASHGAAASTASASGGVSPADLEKNKDKKGPEVVAPKVAGIVPPPVPAPNAFDFGFGDDKNSAHIPKSGIRKKEKAEGDLADFEINHNDISNQKGVSIFKLLSNRYILQYDNLLEVANNRATNLPMTKPKKTEVDTSAKGKLKKALKNDK